MSQLKFYSKQIARQSTGDGSTLAERIAVMIDRSRADAVHVGLFNHSVYERRGGEISNNTLGFSLPAESEPEAFVDEFLAAYGAPITLETMIYGYSRLVQSTHQASYSDEAEQAFSKHLLETGEVTPIPVVDDDAGGRDDDEAN